ncbi:MAG: enoyl-CoA hydratase/isomerase family protein [Deltaproteobacteria bacterium]|nr:enoyl-CoA hydratase/isomerase family protein [Deltaproteobacteria bacterium]
MPEYKQIIYEKNDRIAWVKLNRPKYLNAQSHIMLDEMDSAFHLAAEDKDVRVIILAGEGDHFSSGHDLGTSEEKADEARQGYVDGPAGVYDKYEKIFQKYGFRWRELPKATIAMIHGYCIFGGCEIAASMDMVVAADDTKFLPSFIEFFTLPWEIGVRKTKEVLFRNRFVSPEKALELGFINHVVPREKLKEETLKLANEIAENDPFMIRMMKLSVNEAEDAMGYRVAIQAALSNYLLMSSTGSQISKEEREAGKKSLGPVDQARQKLMNNILLD